MPETAMPNELLNLIVENIDIDSSEGLQALLACSCTNLTLRHMAQGRVFQNVTLLYHCTNNADSKIILVEEKKEMGSKFLNLITRSPPIATYVQRLTIDVRVPLNSSDSSSLASSQSNEFSLRKLLPRLHNLDKLILGPSICLAWDRIERCTKELFVDIVPLVPMLDLRLFDKFPISAFAGCGVLQELSVSTFTWDDSARLSKTSSTMSKVNLRILDIGQFVSLPTSLLSWFISPLSTLNIGHLRDLRISCAFYPELDIVGVLELCANTLERLCLWVNHVNAELLLMARGDTSLKLSPLRRLHQLTIKASLRCHRSIANDISAAYHADRLLYIGSILKTLPSDEACDLPRLQLEILLRLINVPNFHTDIPQLPWTDLATVLNHHFALGYLEEVKIVFEIIVTTRHIQHKEGLEMMMLDNLNGNDSLRILRDRGLLSYTFL